MERKMEQLIKENSELEIVLRYEQNNRNIMSPLRINNIQEKINDNLEEIKTIKDGTCEINYVVTNKKKCID
jgi:hypothetical protein